GRDSYPIAEIWPPAASLTNDYAALHGDCLNTLTQRYAGGDSQNADSGTGVDKSRAALLVSLRLKVDVQLRRLESALLERATLMESLTFSAPEFSRPDATPHAPVDMILAASDNPSRVTRSHQHRSTQLMRRYAGGLSLTYDSALELFDPLLEAFDGKSSA